MKKERIVVVCPGRGSYGKTELGYLNSRSQELEKFISHLDQRKLDLGEVTISELDQADKFKASLHTKGHNASTLIYACSYADFLKINRDKYEVVAVTGNSMGWYIALAVAGALNPDGAFDVINTMGSMMKDQLIGGQIIYPVVNEDWRKEEVKLDLVESELKKLNSTGKGRAYVSIYLGGYVVIGGDKQGLAHMMSVLPKEGDYPFQLINHGAFHTPLLREVSQKAFGLLSQGLFQRPVIPMIDGRGILWTTYGTDTEYLYEYTLGHQVTETYDFTAALTVALKEFAPDKLVLLGPGNSLGGAIGQTLIENNWYDISNKSKFSERQKENPFLISMGITNQKETLK